MTSQKNSPESLPAEQPGTGAPEKRPGRSTNLELLRIICIFAIIGDHMIGQSGIFTRRGLREMLFYTFGNSLSRVGCAVFVIIGAWFMVDRMPRTRKILQIWLTVFGFTAAWLGYSALTGRWDPQTAYVYLLPVEESPLWFAGFYIVLMLCSPMLNLFLRKAGKPFLQSFLLLFFGLLCLYPTVTARLGLFSHDLWVLIFLYLLTGYWKKYRPVPSRRKASLCFLIPWILLSSLRAVCWVWPAWNWGCIPSYLEVYRARMQTVPNLVMSFSLFFWFSQMKVPQSRAINRVASYSLGVYCFHQVPQWAPVLWRDVLKVPFHANFLLGWQRGVFVLGCVALVWIAGSLLEAVRQFLSGLLIENRQWFRRLCRRADHVLFAEDPGNPDWEKDRKKGTVILVIILSLWFLLSVLLTPVT